TTDPRRARAGDETAGGTTRQAAAAHGRMTSPRARRRGRNEDRGPLLMSSGMGNLAVTGSGDPDEGIAVQAPALITAAGLDLLLDDGLSLHDHAHVVRARGEHDRLARDE